MICSCYFALRQAGFANGASCAPDSSLARAQQGCVLCTCYSATNHSWQPSNYSHRLSELATCNKLLNNFVK
jgi:hypothetical protein